MRETSKEAAVKIDILREESYDCHVVAVLPTVSDLQIPGVYLFTLPHYPDARGTFTKTFHSGWRELIPELHRPAPEDWQVHETFFSRSIRGVLRGFHFQEPPCTAAKWVLCEEGEILDVWVDLRAGSPTFGKAESAELRADTPQMLYLPHGIAHAFYTRSEKATMLYYCSHVYAPECDKGILWSSVDFDWPDRQPLTSSRDTTFPALADYRTPFVFDKK